MPFDEDKAFALAAHEPKPQGLSQIRQGLSTAPVNVTGKRDRLNPPLQLEDNTEERPLAITNGGIDDFNDS